MNKVCNALVICAPTFFRNRDSPRYAASLQTLATCKKLGLRVVLVDGSPFESGIHDDLQMAGALVVREEAEGKARALRQALRIAAERFDEAEVFAFQELEKTDFVRFYESLVPCMLQHCQSSGSLKDGQHWQLCNPSRSESSWSTYPTEQVLEERFQNRLANLIAKEYGFHQDLDWSFGPFLLRREYVQAWVEFAGQSYDAQWGPMIVAYRANPHIRIGSPVVDFEHSEAMRVEEEGNLDHALRRLQQLQDTAAAFQLAWSA